MGFRGVGFMMSRYHQPTIIPVPEKRKHMFLDDYSITVQGVKITVPGYFLFSASVPLVGWGITYNPHDPVVNMPAGVHDWLAYNHQVSFDKTNDIFHELLIGNGANPIKAKTMYWAVQKFKFWWELKEEDIDYLKFLYQMVRKSPRFDEYHFPEIGMTA